MSSRRPPYIAYVTSFEPQDVEAWSGLIHHIRRALANAGAELDSLSNLKKRPLLPCIVKKLYYEKLKKQNYHRDREPALQRSYSRQINRSLLPEHDLIFSPGTLAIGLLKTDKPIVVWTDATFANLVADYPDYENLSAETLKNGHDIERQILKRADLLFYSSDWAAQSAIHDYGADPAKVHVIPFGANMQCRHDSTFIRQNAGQKSRETCQLLFIGGDWKRKGGDKALAVAQALNDNGVPTELHIVGGRPKEELPHFVTTYGWLSKKDPDQYKTLHELLLSSHFFIMPSKSEAFGVVFAEAASYGLPSLATMSGGIPNSVTVGQSGFLFELDAAPDEYCEVIQKYMSDHDAYLDLATSTFATYCDRLNWQAAGGEAMRLIEEMLEKKLA